MNGTFVFVGVDLGLQFFGRMLLDYSFPHLCLNEGTNKWTPTAMDKMLKITVATVPRRRTLSDRIRTPIYLISPPFQLEVVLGKGIIRATNIPNKITIPVESQDIMKI